MKGWFNTERIEGSVNTDGIEGWLIQRELKGGLI